MTMNCTWNICSQCGLSNGSDPSWQQSNDSRFLNSTQQRTHFSSILIIFVHMYLHISECLPIWWYFINISRFYTSQIVLYFFQSTLVLSFYIDVLMRFIIVNWTLRWKYESNYENLLWWKMYLKMSSGRTTILLWHQRVEGATGIASQNGLAQHCSRNVIVIRHD